MSITVALVTILLVSLAAVPASEAKTDEALLGWKDAVVTVHVKDGDGSSVASGSGFFLDSGGIVATSCNIIGRWIEKLEYTMVVKTDEGATFPIMDLLSGNCRNKLALIKVKGDDFTAANLASAYVPRRGESVFVIDRSSGRRTILSGVVIGSPVGKEGIFQVSFSVTKEREGSAVFNAKGEVIGILIFPPGMGWGRHIVVPVKDIKKEFGKFKDFTKETSLSRPMPASLPPPVSVPGIMPRPTERTPDEEFRRGVEYESAKMYKEAIEAFERAIAMKPDYGEAYASLGLVYYRIGRYPEAIAAYKQAITVKPDVSVYNRLGTAYVLTGEHAQAINTFKQSLRLDPASAETHFSLGIACVIAGDRDCAVGEYLILKELDRARAERLLDLIR